MNPFPDFLVGFWNVHMCTLESCWHSFITTKWRSESLIHFCAPDFKTNVSVPQMKVSMGIYTFIGLHLVFGKCSFRAVDMPADINRHLPRPSSDPPSSTPEQAPLQDIKWQHPAHSLMPQQISTQRVSDDAN